MNYGLPLAAAPRQTLQRQLINQQLKFSQQRQTKTVNKAGPLGANIFKNEKKLENLFFPDLVTQKR